MAVSEKELDIIVDLLNGIYDDDPVEEDEAWRLFAKMFIEGPIPRYVRVMIANVSDPTMRATLKRRLAFKRERGRRKSVDDRQVAAVVWHRIKAGDQKDAAYQEAVDKLGVSISTAEKAFAKWKKIFDRDGSKVKGLTRTSG
jgi:hypothetical protein